MFNTTGQIKFVKDQAAFYTFVSQTFEKKLNVCFDELLAKMNEFDWENDTPTQKRKIIVEWVTERTNIFDDDDKLTKRDKQKLVTKELDSVYVNLSGDMINYLKDEWIPIHIKNKPQYAKMTVFDRLNVVWGFESVGQCTYCDEPENRFKSSWIRKAGSGNLIPNVCCRHARNNHQNFVEWLEWLSKIYIKSILNLY